MNTSLWLRMEHWNEKEIKELHANKVITAGGNALSNKPRNQGKFDRDGIKRKIRAAAFSVIKQKRIERKKAGQKK
jgi:hypothetical protein